MKKVLSYVLLILVLCAPVVQANEQVPITVDAEGFVILDEESQMIQAEDNVVIQMGEDYIKADKVEVDLTAKTIKASGNILLVQEGREVSGDALEYDYISEEGKFYNAKAAEENIKFKGKVINILKDEMVMEDTDLIPGYHDYDDYHYKLTAEKIDVYPDGKVVAKGVYLWIKGKRILPLPTFTTTLSSDPTEQRKYAIPEPKLGYNRDNGAYLEVNYDHYVDEKLEGFVHFKATSKKGNQLDLDYDYAPSENFQFKPDLSYDQEIGLDGSVNLINKIGGVTSNLSYNAYIEDDEDDPDYKDKEWLARWDLTTDIFGVKSGLHLRRDEDDPETGKEITFDKSWSDYYWQLRAGADNEYDYKPQFSLGIKNKDLGNGTLLSTDLRIVNIYERDTDVETSRRGFDLRLRDSQVGVSDNTNLYWNGGLSASEYGTGDDFQTYDFNLGIDQKVAFLDFNLDYQYYNEFGQTPFEFDLLTDEDEKIGERNYITASIGSDLELNDDLDLEWNALVRKSNYEGGDDYNYYQFNTKTSYQINEYNSIALGYNYVGTVGETPIEDEEVERDDLYNEVSVSYNFQTNQLEFPYWDVEIEAGYDFIEDELSTLKYSLTREFDCFNTGIEYDQLEKDIRLNLELKF